MLLSHLVFDRCVLNELVRRLRHFKKASEPKLRLYEDHANMGLGRRSRRSKSKALTEEIIDYMPSPDLKP